MAAKALPTPDALRQLLDYDPETGLMHWRERDVSWFRDDRVNTAAAICRAWNTKYAGREAFTARLRGGYRVTNLGGTVLLGHRVAFALHYGRWPRRKVDHINGVRDDNRIANLRTVSDRENALNRRGAVAATSRHKGVSWNEKRRHWIAQMSDRSGGRYLGAFACETAAALAYDHAAMAVHGEYARLNINEPRSLRDYGDRHRAKVRHPA